VFAECHPDNLASLRVMHKIGLRPEAHTPAEDARYPERLGFHRCALTAAEWAAVAGVPANPYRIDEAELGEGSGTPTSRAREAMRLCEQHGLHLDATYTGKTFAAVTRLLRDGECERVLYIHTLSSAPLAPLMKDAPSIPHRLDRLLR